MIYYIYIRCIILYIYIKHKYKTPCIFNEALNIEIGAITIDIMKITTTKIYYFKFHVNTIFR